MKKAKIWLTLSKVVANTPSPMSISYMWNFGSLLMLCLMIQIVSGLFLSTQYSSNMADSFASVVHITTDVNLGWLFRSMHANGATAFFICIYLHIGRGLYYSSYYMMYTWMIGILILLLLMGTAFMGYVLPWGQMSFWGATVITNLLSAVPYVGDMIVQWIWGGFSVEKPTLMRFFSIHFILPFILAFMVLIHIVMLHTTGSSNPLGIPSDSYKINFHPYFLIKDLVGFVIFGLVFMFLVLIKGDMFMDCDNFMLANPMNTPAHIQPEWYFLFAYAILRSIPNKLGGVLALLMSILILLVMPFMKKTASYPSMGSKLLFWLFFGIFFNLTWLGAMPVEYPYETFSQVMAILYFFVLFCMMVV
nr:cytochrome b [Fulicoffula longipila]